MRRKPKSPPKSTRQRGRLRTLLGKTTLHPAGVTVPDRAKAR
jgi:hypothetical protein